MHNPEADYSQINLVKISDLGTTEAIDIKDVAEVGVAHKLMFNLDKKLVKLTLKIVVNASSGKEVANSMYDFVFEIANLHEFHLLESDKVVFQSTLISVLAGLGYSTLRGILLQYWQNRNFILPVIEPKKILAERI
jgi:hypothetical protein